MRFQTVFLDRDGVLTDHAEQYCLSPEDLGVFPSAGPAVARLNQAGLLVIVITNQSAIGRGWLTVAGLEQTHDRLRAELATAGAHLDDLLYCPHAPDDGCDCRKPAPGMLRRAAARHGLDLSAAVMVGDNLSDIGAGQAAGCATILIRDGEQPADQQPRADLVVPDLPAAVDWILEPCGS